MVETICDAGQPDAIHTAEIVLGFIINGAAAMRYMRMHPRLTEESTLDLLHIARIREGED
jgi:hypothetical protein